MKFKYVKILIVFLIVLIVVFFVKEQFLKKGSNKSLSFNDKNSGGNIKQVQVPITKENLAYYLKSQKIIQDLPRSANLELILYNYDKGYRELEESYSITKGDVKKGSSEDPDMIIYLSSKYIDYFSSEDFCSVIKKAKLNGDVGYDIRRSQTILLFKYGKMLNYKDCFG